MRPLSPATLVLASLVAATIVIRPLAHGVPAATILAFWATTLGQAVLPGMLLVRGARLCAADASLLLGQGATLGLALQGLAMLAGRALSAPWLPSLVAIAAAGVGLGLARRGAPVRPAASERGAATLTLAVALAAALLQPLASAQRLDAPLPFDLLFHAGNAAELRHRWPLENPRVAGIPLNYHLLAYALPVEAADLAQAPVADPLLALAPLLWVTLLALQAANAGRVLLGSASAGALGAAVLLLHTDPGGFFGLARGAFNSHLATGIYGSPSTLCGLVLLAGIVIALEAWLVDARRSRLASLLVLALATSAAKTTVLPVVLAGVAVAWLHALVLARRTELSRLALAFAVMAAAGAPWTLWQTGGGDESYTAIVRFTPGTAFSTSAFAGAIARAVGTEQLPAALVAPAFALWLIGYLGLAGVAATLWLVRHRGAQSPLQVFSLGVIAAGAVLGLVLDVPGLSQLFLLYNGQLLLSLFAGAALAEAPAWPWRRAPTLATAALVGFFALPSLAQLVWGLPATMRADLAAAAHSPSPIERDYAAGLAWLRARASRDSVVFADNPSLLLSAIGEVRLYYENGLYTARAWHAGPAREPWPERAALQQRLLRRPDIAVMNEARRAVGPRVRLLIAADAVQSRIEAGFVYAAPGPVPARRFFPPELFERPYVSATLQVYEAREVARRLSPR